MSLALHISVAANSLVLSIQRSKALLVSEMRMLS